MILKNQTAIRTLPYLVIFVASRQDDRVRAIALLAMDPGNMRPVHARLAHLNMRCETWGRPAAAHLLSKQAWGAPKAAMKHLFAKNHRVLQDVKLH